MKEEILSIASDLREGSMTTNEAKECLLRLFGVKNSICTCDKWHDRNEESNNCCSNCNKPIN